METKALQLVNLLAHKVVSHCNLSKKSQLEIGTALRFRRTAERRAATMATPSFRAKKRRAETCEGRAADDVVPLEESSLRDILPSLDKHL